jgi:hypothetical protein
MNMGGADTTLTMLSGLSIRQNFCNIVNSIWGLGIWCEPNESILNMDVDGDGTAYNSDSDAQNGGVEDNE